MLPTRSAIFLLVFAAAAVATHLPPRSSDAHTVPGEFGLYVNASVDEVAVGSSFTVSLGVEHDRSQPYQAVQWQMDFDESTVSFVSLATGAPTQCASFDVSAAYGRVLAACIWVPSMTYAGTAYTMTFRCNAPGTVPLPLIAVGLHTKVWLAYDVLAPIHVHADSVLCSADADADGLPDTYEQTHPCLDWQVPETQSDHDADGLGTPAEFAVGTDPCAGDSDADSLSDPAELRNGTDPTVPNPDATNADDDGDGCDDVSETASQPTMGGQRDPLYKWDFFDLTNDRAVDLSDTLDVLVFFGNSGAAGTLGDLRDRAILNQSFPWQLTESNDGVDLTDALNSLLSFGHGCGGT